MLRPKKKISRRELKQDKLVTSYAKVTSFYDQHKRNISIGITAVVAIIIIAVVIIKNRSDNNERAMAQLAQVQQFYDSGQYQVAIDGAPERNIPGLKSIVENYGGTTSGGVAQFYLADCYFQLAQYEEALKNFEDFSPSDDMLAASRHAGIAACQEVLGKYQDAAENFEKAAGKQQTEPAAAEDYANAARNYSLAGDKEKALDLYKRLKKSYPTTAPGREAERFITQLSL
jgi:tetratricopeptide (TPR) repeat protein